MQVLALIAAATLSLLAIVALLLIAQSGGQGAALPLIAPRSPGMPPACVLLRAPEGIGKFTANPGSSNPLPPGQSHPARRTRRVILRALVRPAHGCDANAPFCT